VPVSDHDSIRGAARRAVRAMTDAPRERFDELYAPDAVHREAVREPQDCRQPGPAGFFATATWLRAAFSDLAWADDDVVATGDLAVVHGRMSGRHTGTFVTYRPDGTVERAFSPTGKAFCTRQAHFLRVRDGLVVEHWAVRDDLAQAQELGWIPPTPWYLLRCARATATARRRLASG